ncbi:bi-domain-containing oxidoreductase [Prosthecochloris sp. CIB 2401]|uniref:bi-domain-containing oxidoreductase n=1 Tax=Prosthecochloris sp. CIB 2401 TaxID=1868325 RepID=UPI00080ABF26|nr:bi-domain-containing oxidoreductase [Prosthecochloris sp. CIB 2401]ANT65155.1 Inositol 2-dehydrogenase [Prosthecochloris sp. CIB 2401]
MKQIIQDIKDGQTILEEVPVPKVKSGHVLVKTSRTLVSLGTERMLVDFGKANFIDKARQQPDKVKQVLDKVKTDGVKPTYESVMNKLGQPLPLGYCNVGEVVAVGKGVTEFRIGDRVASNGPHAEYVLVPVNLAAKVPDGVSDEEAAFTVIGSIALQGIRLLAPTFGETVVVVGLGLIGLITAELLRANGCVVIGFDFDEQKVAMAREKGVHAVNLSNGSDPVAVVQEMTGEIGCDGVIITASNSSDEIMHQAAEMSRKRGRIILVGVVGLKLRRDDFYKKELSFQVSCSYGPGRYDEAYENKGQDYPIGYVRWTEKRNFEAILQAIAAGQLDVKRLITERVKLEEYAQIYGDMKKPGSIASILKYSHNGRAPEAVVSLEERAYAGQKAVLGIIGAGNFASSTILPCLEKTPAVLKYIASSGGLTATTMAKKFGAAKATSDYKLMLQDKDVDTVVITTRHNTHASMVIEALQAGKHVFVEKPLALNNEELEGIVSAYSALSTQHSGPIVMVGFNRRFAPLALKMKELIGDNVGPVNIVATMNAGAIPPDVWVHDPEVGGGRIIGEACHFIDLCSYLAGSRVTAVCMNAMGVNPDETTDNASILLKYENGSNAVINYFANGSKSYAKERVEVFSQQKVLVMDNWRKLQGYGFGKFKSASSAQDKGHANQFSMFVERLQKGGEALIPFGDLVNTTKASFAAIESMKRGEWITVQ